jgi:hypothetical protein
MVLTLALMVSSIRRVDKNLSLGTPCHRAEKFRRQSPSPHKLGHVDILCDEIWLLLGAHTGELIRSELKFVLGGGPAYAADRINTSSGFDTGVNAGPQNEARLKFDGSRHLKPDRRALHLLHRLSLLPAS